MDTPETIKITEILPSEPIFCPFCGLQAYPGDEAEDWTFDAATDVCEHTIFVATDAGFEYRASRFNDHMGLPDDQDPEPDFPEDGEDSTGYDGFTSKVSIPGSVKFASYTPAPSFFGVYYGFAPLE